MVLMRIDSWLEIMKMGPRLTELTYFDRCLNNTSGFMKYYLWKASNQQRRRGSKQKEEQKSPGLGKQEHPARKQEIPIW